MIEDDMRKSLHIYKLGHFATQQKSMEHCKSTIIQKNLRQKIKIIPIVGNFNKHLLCAKHYLNGLTRIITLPPLTTSEEFY